MFNSSYLSRSAGIRTLGPLIKSQLLYQLSYRPILIYFTYTSTLRPPDKIGMLYQLSYRPNCVQK